MLVLLKNSNPKPQDLHSTTISMIPTRDDEETKLWAEQIHNNFIKNSDFRDEYDSKEGFTVRNIMTDCKNHVVVEDRKATTLLPLIQEHIRLGTHIVRRICS